MPVHSVAEPLECRALLAAVAPAASAADGVTPAALGNYHTYATLGSDLAAYAAAHPSVARLTSLGKSVQNRDLWALKISDNPDVEEDEPEAKYVGTMHGNEPVGQEMCLYLIDRLLGGYGTDSRVTALIDSTELWIVPNMNPDGLELNLRGNANGVDLNRDFPEGSSPNNIRTIFDGSPLNTAGRQPETVAVMRWSAGQSFTVAANFHTGALVANYPYDTNGNGFPDYAASPDDALFRQIALTYSVHNAPMYNSPEFPQGITNGDAWYEVAGGMQDWTYRYLSGNEITVELSDVKRPAAGTLPTLWDDNRESMLSYLETAHWGVRGGVADARTGEPVYARVTVQNNSHPVYSDPDVGDYHRMLLPGTYSLTFEADGYAPRTVNGVVMTGTVNPAGGSAVNSTRLDVALTPLSAPATVADRHVFYNNSTFDGNNTAADAADDDAVAPDKEALRPGQLATAANYTSYSRGINGVMVDVLNLPDDQPPLAAADFTVRVGNGNTNPDNWAAGPAPLVSVRRGAGAGGSDRVTLVWPDNAIRKTWLQVTVASNTRTGLAAADVFYFGNAPGDTMNGTDAFAVNSQDVARTRNAQRKPATTIQSLFDHNRDGRVNTQDVAVSRNNQRLKLTRMTAPGATPAPGDPVPASAPAADTPGAPRAGRRSPAAAATSLVR